MSDKEGRLRRCAPAWAWQMMLVLVWGAWTTAALADTLHLQTGQGVPLPSELSLQAGAQLDFQAVGGSGAYLAHVEPNAAGVAGTLERLRDGGWRYTAPTDGAFAGLHRVAVTDVALGWRVELAVEVLLDATLSPDEVLAGADNVRLTLRGAVPGATLHLDVLDAEGLPTEAVVLPPEPLHVPPSGELQVDLATRDVPDDTRVRLAVSADGLQGVSNPAQLWVAQPFAGHVFGEAGEALDEAEVRFAGLILNGRRIEAVTDAVGRFQLLAPRHALEGLLLVAAAGHEAGEFAAAACASDADYAPACTLSLSALTLEQAAKPRIEADGPLVQGESVSISTATEGAIIRYTLDGSDPSREHGDALGDSGEIVLDDDASIRAMAYQDGLADSLIASADYELSAGQVDPPTFDPPAGTYEREVKVRLSTDTSHAKIMYTLDGSTPTRRNGKKIDSGKRITLKESALLRAMAYRDRGNFEDSPVVNAHYLIVPEMSDDKDDDQKDDDKKDDDRKDEDRKDEDKKDDDRDERGGDSDQGDQSEQRDDPAPREPSDGGSDGEETQEAGEAQRLAGGGGCTLRGAGTPDPLHPLMILGALAVLGWRLRQGQR
ncbi:chitobiase/beta-hexosaminidase C-terminal domain-containing protein [Ectothiorhodospiraceae bacterium 2226]|nr:chitobiase/beta-hexosaminidase C-terminal domain-containing protein [Ectothiorhodospiraceae bacterium 2226]